MEINKKIRPIATPLTIFTSLVVFLSGILMYFKLKTHLLEEIHSQIGILFLIGTILHLTLNWRPFVNYFKKASTYLLLVPVILIALFLYLNEGNKDKGGNLPPGLVFNRLENASFRTVKDVFKPNPQILMDRIMNESIKIENEDLSIKDIAHKNNIDPKELLSIIAKSE